MDQILRNAALIIFAYGSRYDEYSEYQLLIRAINEPTKSDLDATYRKKAGEEHRGYIANVVEVADNGHNSITVNYQCEKNTYSDSQFFKDYIG